MDITTVTRSKHWITSNAHQTGQTIDAKVISYHHGTGTTTIREPQDSNKDEDSKNEDFVK